MAMWHGYVGVEDLALALAQRAAIIAVLRALGPESDDQPAHVMQLSPALDGSKAIFEAEFLNADNLTADSVKIYLANAVGVNPVNITTTTQQTQYGPVVIYSAGGVARLRYLVFGGLAATWPESRAACEAYKFANITDWEPEEA